MFGKNRSAGCNIGKIKQTVRVIDDVIEFPLWSLINREMEIP